MLSRMRRVLENVVRHPRAVAGRVKRRLRPPPPRVTSIETWGIAPDRAPALLAQADSEMARQFYGHEGRPVHKWTHYLDRYEQHFARYRGTSVGMLEIGVFQGGSLQLWRSYFGPEARIMGVDIDPECAARVDAPNVVRIGSQDDPEFLRACVAELGAPLDIVLDDGSHIGRHQWTSFQTLFPLVTDGGLYVIEDLHTSYWADFEGRADDSTTGIGLVHALMEDLHAWYHENDESTPAKNQVVGIHVYDSMVFIEKARRSRPEHILIGDGPPEEG